MANRRSLANRRKDVNAPLRPAVGYANEYDSALRSDFSYIPEDLDPPEAILMARDMTHTSVEVAFDPLSIPSDPNFGAPTEIALVRSPSGFPTTILDGNVIRRHPPTAPDNGGWVRIPDTGLTPGTWYYYGLFAKYFSGGNTHWLRIGEVSVLLPAEYLSADHLWERIPEWYRRQDMEPGNVDGVLRRLINTVGYQTDQHRTWARTVGDVWDAEKLSADLLPYLGDTLGQPVEYAAGDERYRALLSRILPLRKMKGTEHGTEAYLSSITGFRTRVYSGLNLLPTSNEAEARYTSGLWQASTANSALTRVLSTGAATPGPANGRYYHRMTYNTTTSQQPALRLGSGVAGNLASTVPFEAGHQIITSAFFRSSFIGVYNVRYRWFGTDGVLKGTNTVALGAIDGTWVRRTAPAVIAPAGTAFVEVNLELSVATTTAGLVVETTDILVADRAWRPEDVPGMANIPPLSTTNPGEYSDTGYYETPRTAHVNVYPQRINFALNSDFVLDNEPVGAWTVAERATWGLLKQAYDSWGDIHDEVVGDSEQDWGDLAEGFEPLAGNWTISFDTAQHRLVMTPSGAVTSILTSPGYLNSVGSPGSRVMTPDTPDSTIAADCVITAKVNKAELSSGKYETICSTIGTSTLQYGWRLWFVNTGQLAWGYSLDGTTAVNDVTLVTLAQLDAAFNASEDFYIGVKIDIGTPTVVQAITSTDGVTWTNIGTAVTLPGTGIPADVTSRLQIGCQAENGQHPWQGRIYWVEMRTGLVPGQGTLRWRFDANERTGTGTVYTDPRGRTWTLSPTVNAITPAVWEMRYTGQVQSHFVPVVPGDSISVAFIAWATVPDVEIMFTVEFFTAEGPQYILSIDGVRQAVHGAGNSMTTSPHRYELRNAVVPEGASFARVIVEMKGTSAFNGYLQQALIENAQIPGPYFDGNEVDGAYGDFFFIGQPHESYSVYYQNYRSFINDAGGGDRITSLMTELLPMGTNYIVRTAAAGLY
jgi:hypothetical protein